jgi:hypothetical protein
MGLGYRIPKAIDICDILTTGTERLSTLHGTWMSLFLKPAAKLSGFDARGDMKVEELAEFLGADSLRWRRCH